VIHEGGKKAVCVLLNAGFKTKKHAISVFIMNDIDKYSKDEYGGAGTKYNAIVFENEHAIIEPGITFGYYRHRWRSDDSVYYSYYYYDYSYEKDGFAALGPTVQGQAGFDHFKLVTAFSYQFRCDDNFKLLNKRNFATLEIGMAVCF
jgi:hypothetical protein